MSARVGIGALLGIRGGPATYARELVAALVRAGRHEYRVFTDRPEAFADLGVEAIHVPLTTPYHQVTWDHAQLPGLISRHELDLYHGTKNVLPLRVRVPCVVTIHDLAVYACPETFAAPQRWHFKLFVPWSARRAARVIAVSEHAHGDLVQRFGLDPTRVPVVHNGIGEDYRRPVPKQAIDALRSEHDLEGPLVVSVGTVQPRKRVERVIEAFRRAGAASRGWQLAVAGRVRPGYRPGWLAAPPEGVRWLGPLPDDALRALYAAAEIFVSASEYEGFGLTVGEAMASACAVLAVGVTSVPEVVGDAGILVDRSDSGLLAEALERLLGDADLRAGLAGRARERSARFTWDESARGTADVYDEALA